MSHAGEVRESVFIDCKHWNTNINLVARRQGSLWTIWRSDTGQAVTNLATLDTRWVDLNSTYWPNVRVEWDGNNFRVKLPNQRTYIESTKVLTYMGHDARETWRCYWDPRQNEGIGGFHHTCVRIA
jgi:hypothetical protein